MFQTVSFFGDTINSIIVQPIRLSHFHNILTAIKHAKEYTPELVTLMTYDYGEITKQFRARIAPHITKARKQFKSLGVTMDNDTDTVITLSGKPLESVNVIWNWLHLTPEDADTLSPEKLWEKQKTPIRTKRRCRAFKSLNRYNGICRTSKLRSLLQSHSKRNSL